MDWLGEKSSGTGSVPNPSARKKLRHRAFRHRVPMFFKPESVFGENTFVVLGGAAFSICRDTHDLDFRNGDIHGPDIH
jgi:hypothetical protein